MELFQDTDSPHQPLAGTSWVIHREGATADADVVGAEACARGLMRDARWIDVNVLLSRVPARGTRVRVAGRVIQMGGHPYLQSACRASRDSVDISLRMVDAACAREDDLVVVDARFDELSLEMRMCQADGFDAELADAHLVGTPTASQVCNFSRSHPS